ncbi:hypothetical protein Fmac_031064 [Flemingia macrophylla]|uniref:DDE Tnp4 domain-containing protein n=1 Tax=Flemingia macrophylla TaxID=520843 RepID=A0ABD1L110_9FABA
MLKGQIITPYRGVRYHLKEYSQRSPQNPRELFNRRHSLLRNVIERTFGVLKKRFPIIASGTEPHYSLDTMTNIILACCILHNFLRGVDNDDSLLAEVDRELMEEDVDTMSTQVREEDYREGSNLRDSIANEIGKAIAPDSSIAVREFTKWIEDMDFRLLTAMLDEARLGNRVDGSWTTQAYNNMVESLRQLGLIGITKNNVKNRQKSLKDR